MKAIRRASIVLGMMILCGCSQREEDVQGIRRSYMSFREALVATNSNAAAPFITDNVHVLLPTKIFSVFDDVVKPEFALTAKSHITFDKKRSDHAWLWPNSRPSVGTYGIGLTKETNTWKINGEFVPVSH